MNRYAYTVGNPTTLVDVGGYRPWDPAYTVVGKNKSGWVFEKVAVPRPGKVKTLAPGKAKAKTPSDRTRTTASHAEWWQPYAWSQGGWGVTGYVQVSPHVYSAHPGEAARMADAYRRALAEFGMSSRSIRTESQEIALWKYACTTSRNACPAAFKSEISSTGFMASDHGLAIEGMVAAGGAYFFTGSGGSGAIGSHTVVRSLAEPASMVGATEAQVRSMIPQGWEERPMVKGDGVKWGVPGRREGDFGQKGFIEYSRGGSPGTAEPLHQGGAYTRVDVGGLQYRAAGAGNSTIGTPAEFYGKNGSTGSQDLTRQFRFGGSRGR